VENSAEKKYIFFLGGRTVEVGSVYQTGLTTTVDSLHTLQSAMLEIAFSNMESQRQCELAIFMILIQFILMSD